MPDGASKGGRAVTLPVDGSRLQFRGGIYASRAVIDPDLLPAVCARCGGPGAVQEESRFADPLPRGFWIGLGAFLGFPLLFGLGAVVIGTLSGGEGLGDYARAGAAAASVLGVLGGLWMARSAARRGQWALVFHLCAACGRRHRLLRRWGSGAAWAAVGSFAAMVLSAPVWMGPEVSVAGAAWLVLTVLGTLTAIVAGVALAVRARRFPGVSARLHPASQAVTVAFRNAAVARAVAASREGHR